MDPSNLELGLSELRRELKEILSMIEARPGRVERAVPQPLDASSCDAHDASSSHPRESEAEPSSHESSRHTSASDPERLFPERFDEALVVITEFGEASPAVLQMWLSIDYGCAMRILSEFETLGLVSPRGKVRHKAYDLRRSKGIDTN
jgi:hypothetical protein